MILRRIATAFRKQDWFTVFIETLIVVFGVFIGLQVNNWNTSRQEHQLEQGYLRRLHADFVRSVENADNNIGDLEKQNRLEGVIIRQLRQCRLEDDMKADFDLGLFTLGQLEPPPLVSDTIDELRSTGRMEIIRDLELRNDIANAVRRQDTNAEILSYIVARVSPQINYIDSRVAFDMTDDEFDRRYQDGIPEGAAIYDFDALCNDFQFQAAVMTIRQATRVVISHNEKRRADYLRLIERLEE